ncbi:hypothetical protein [Rhizobium halophilum]|uniref:hypothetical protein n=1 Tax=Rhizobium halophilum TaxID=2846852 RepID=UPI001EFD051C|nr:hypothetical protein [Rhizobium halophilum]MCF6369153.1 hypothetical protein [Rhizobium halophilum]
MLSPTQAASGLAATTLMQSTLDSLEERRRQDEEKASGSKKDPVVEARISASTESRRAQGKIAEALFGINNIDPNELKMKLTERLAARLGIDLEEERSSYALGKAIEDAVKELDSDQIAKLQKDLGLADAGVTLATVIAAIKNPYGDDNARLMEGMTKVANGGKATFDVQRVLQRLEDVADPKTLEELKLGPQGYDPTRVEDAQTRAERQEDIQALEASEKLEDIQEMQDAVELRNDRAATPRAPDGEVADATETDMVLLLGATVEQAKSSEHADNPPPAESAASPENGVALGGLEEPNEVNAEAMEELAEDVSSQTGPDVLPISVDDMGLYELLKKKLAA